MQEKRKFKRFDCNIKTTFFYFEGNPEEIDIKKESGKKTKGSIIDISCGGVFIATNENIPTGRPVKLQFKLKKYYIETTGKIVRAGTIVNNPTETAQKIKDNKVKADLFIAVEFDNELETLNEEDM